MIDTVTISVDNAEDGFRTMKVCINTVEFYTVHEQTIETEGFEEVISVIKTIAKGLNAKVIYNGKE